MSMYREKIIKILDEIYLAKEHIVLIEREENFKNIYRESFIKYRDMDGRLVWDRDLLFNKLIFIDSKSGKFFLLGETKSDDKLEEVFYYLSQEYEIENHKYFSKITILYETKKAQEAAEKLNAYIGFPESILMNEKEYRYLIKSNQFKTDKVIILGDNLFVRQQIKKVGGKKIGPGMLIGYDRHICCLMSERSAFKRGKNGREQFGEYYEKEIKTLENCANELDIPVKFNNNKSTTSSMYNFLLTVFVDKQYINDFLVSEYTDDYERRADKLCEELIHNSQYKTYITPELLNKICEKQKYFKSTPKKRKGEDENAWKDLYISNTGRWFVQRYWNKDYCRIYNTVEGEKAYGTVEQILGPILNHCRRMEALKNVTNRDWGIVFCGGGGKGAYQIGVWEWLIDHGVAERITGVSGASVGALNSLLFVEGNYELAKEVWQSVAPRIIMDQNGIPILQSQGALSKLIKKHMENMQNICKGEKIVYSSLTCINKFPAKALLEYLKNGIVIKDDNPADYYSWAYRTKDEIREIVLASAAIPGVKQARYFEGKAFVDGGLADNVPVRPLIEDGFRNIIVVHLDTMKKAFEKSMINLDDSNVNFYHVYPSEDIGDMLQAGPALTKDRIELGYKDADIQLKELVLFNG